MHVSACCVRESRSLCQSNDILLLSIHVLCSFCACVRACVLCFCVCACVCACVCVCVSVCVQVFQGLWCKLCVCECLRVCVEAGAPWSLAGRSVTPSMLRRLYVAKGINTHTCGQDLSEVVMKISHRLRKHRLCIGCLNCELSPVCVSEKLRAPRRNLIFHFSTSIRWLRTLVRTVFLRPTLCSADCRDHAASVEKSWWLTVADLCYHWLPG